MWTFGLVPVVLVVVAVAVAIAARRPSRLTCPGADCRADNDRDARFCRRCGRRIEFSRSRSVAIAVVVIVATFLVLSILRFVMYAI